MSDLVAAVLVAARAHRPIEMIGLSADCYTGNCDHDDKCPVQTFIVCRECMRIADEIDRGIPDAALAEHCLVWVAVATLEQVQR